MAGRNSLLTRPEAQEQVRLARTRRHGATIVEFSLVFLLFVVVLVALMEFGRAMWTYATIAHAARQGALLYGTRHCKPSHQLRRRERSQKKLHRVGRVQG